MEIDSETQEYRDFDWFCVDGAGEIGHFTTAGFKRFTTAGFKRLPASVAVSAEDLELVTGFFERSLPVRCAHAIDELTSVFPNPKDRGPAYLRDFCNMADRGLFSFDIATYPEPGISYFRVSTPLEPIRLTELPDPIQAIVGRTVLKGRLLHESRKIPYEDTLAM